MSPPRNNFPDPTDPAVAPVETGDTPAASPAPSEAESVDHASPESGPPREDTPVPTQGRKVRKKGRDKVIPETLTLQPIPRRPGSTSRRTMLRSALLVVGLPTLIAAIYFGFIASDQYAANGSFIIKTSYGGTINPAATMAFGMPPTSEITDILAVNEYILSPQILADLEPRLDLRAIYGNPAIDWYARLKPAWGEDIITNEQLLKYWQQMVGVYFDVTTGITSIEVKAFSAADAQKVAAEVLALSEALVNRLAERAKEDSLSFARREVEAFRQQAIAALDAMQAFQEKAKQVDPEAFAKARSEIQAGLEAETTKLQSQLEILRGNLPPEAPAVVQVARRLQVIERQLIEEKAKSTLSEAGESAATVLNEFAKLKMENEFTERAYMDSLASLERSRAAAQKQGLFLEAFIRPQLPQTAEYPQRSIAVFLVFVASVIIWGLGGLFVATAREHL
jgi:capsular polysaccharide transport system permease protein